MAVPKATGHRFTYADYRQCRLTKRALCERAGVREYWLVHPVDRVITRYTLQDGRYRGPEIVETAGERSPAIFPEIVIRWQAILDKLPDHSVASVDQGTLDDDHWESGPRYCCSSSRA